MKQQKLMKIGCVLAALVGFLCLCGIYGSHTVTLDETAVQRQVDRQVNKEFPIKGAAHLVVKSATVTAAKIHIAEGHVMSDITIQGNLVGGKIFTMNSTAQGVPEFTDGAFYFRPDKVEFKDLTYNGATPSKLITAFANRYVSNEKAGRLIADSAPKVESWMTDVTERAATHSLATRPVYRPGDDFKGLLIKASLQSLDIDGNTVKITFTLWRLTVSVITGILLLIASIGYLFALSRNPMVQRVGRVVSYVT